MFPYYRNQSTHLQGKMSDWFLYDTNIVPKPYTKQLLHVIMAYKNLFFPKINIKFVFSHNFTPFLPLATLLG